MTEPIHISFRHGLGDCSNFALLATLYRRHGVDVRVSGDENKQFIWNAAGLEPPRGGAPAIENTWLHPGGFWNLNDADCSANKTAGNISVSPLPEINILRPELWRELCGIDLDAAPHISAEIHAEADQFLAALPTGPIVALHAEGTNNRDAKRIDPQIQIELQQQLTAGGINVVVLDYDARAVAIGHERVRGIKPAWGHIGIDRLAALLSRCALLIGVDSGPLHFARTFCRLPLLGVFFNRSNLLPHRVAIPSPRLTCLVPESLSAIWCSRRNEDVGWQFWTYQQSLPTVEEIVAAATGVIEGTSSRLEDPASVNASGRYVYARIGYDERELELRPDGEVGHGRAEREHAWAIKEVGASVRLHLIDRHGDVTCSLELDAASRVWRGKWNRFEQMPIELRHHQAERLRLTKEMLRGLTSTVYDQRYYDEHKAGGLDYLAYGDWQRRYGIWLLDNLSWKDAEVLDVGCACGSTMRGMIEAGINASGIDISEFMVALGKRQCPSVAALMRVADASDLRDFQDGKFDGIHSSQAAEHWDPDRVAQILSELHRVTALNGLFFCSLDTQELFARQTRSIKTDDPTHICIRPMQWWHDQLDKAGWTVVSHHFEHKMRHHHFDLIAEHDWDWFVATKLS